MNTFTLIGRLTHDVDVRYTEGYEPKAFTQLTLAVDKGKDYDGKSMADFPTVSVWGKQAENCGKYLSKGRMIAVQGSISTSRKEDNQGNKRKYTNLVAYRVEFLGGGENSGNGCGYRQNDNNYGKSQKNDYREPQSATELQEIEPQVDFQMLDESVPF